MSAPDRDALVLDNLALAHHMVAHNFHARCLETEEAASVAYLGLTQAARHFDPERGTAFSTLAVACIRNRITEAAYAQSSLIRWPRSAAPALIQKNKESLACGSERAVRACGWECERDNRVSAPEFESEELREEVARAVDRLSQRARAVIRYRFGFSDGIAHSLAECGKNFGLSREGVRLVETAALAQLRKILEPVM